MLNTEMKMMLKYLKKNNIVVFLQKATSTIATTTLKQILEYCILLLNLVPNSTLMLTISAEEIMRPSFTNKTKIQFLEVLDCVSTW